ncbi:hypothetical protein BX600DRAFT_497685 [Xylariales sp. PMI_506]|nr:hypothetical protein BX600DRAFT_497685 [Xylariales sp. PMI_506]
MSCSVSDGDRTCTISIHHAHIKLFSPLQVIKQASDSSKKKMDQYPSKPAQAPPIRPGSTEKLAPPNFVDKQGASPDQWAPKEGGITFLVSSGISPTFVKPSARTWPRPWPPKAPNHTTRLLGSDCDEYVPRFIDEGGRRRLQQMAVFWAALFGLASQCALVLGNSEYYRLFNSFDTLMEKCEGADVYDTLVAQGVQLSPIWDRPQRIAIVTARSLFRHFGNRVILNGIKFKDDYWQTSAKELDVAENHPDGAEQRSPSRASSITLEDDSHVLHDRDDCSSFKDNDQPSCSPENLLPEEEEDTPADWLNSLKDNSKSTEEIINDDSIPLIASEKQHESEFAPRDNDTNESDSSLSVNSGSLSSESEIDIESWIQKRKIRIIDSEALPIQCPRCWETFKTKTALNLHLQNEPPCLKCENTAVYDGFDEKQEKKLRSRKKIRPDMTDNEKWNHIYLILFPDDEPDMIPSPYYDHVDDVRI